MQAIWSIVFVLVSQVLVNQYMYFLLLCEKWDIMHLALSHQRSNQNLKEFDQKSLLHFYQQI